MAALQEVPAGGLHLAAPPLAGSSVQLGRGVLLPLGFALWAMLVWEIVCRACRVSPALLPPPSAVWTVLSQNTAILMQHAVPTMVETVVSFAIATLLGVVLAVAVTFSAWLREAFYPTIVMVQLVPRIALAPLFIVWLGVGSRSCITVAVFIAFFPVVVSTATGLVSAKPEVLQLCRSLTATEWQMFRMARFPYAMIDRIPDDGRRDWFELIRLKDWAKGRVALVGDAASGQPPFLGQGGGCAMMSAYTLAEAVDHAGDAISGIAEWRRRERRFTERVQRIAYWYGQLARLPPAARPRCSG